MALVTRDNFEEEVARCEEAVSKASFVAFDCEMTGIRLPGRVSDPAIGDTPNQRYLKCKPVAERFSLMQVVCCYKS